MNRKFIIFCYFLILNLASFSVFARAEWTFLVYVQANNNLSSFAEKSFYDMATVGSDRSLNILVEWHQRVREGAWRYKIDNGKMKFDSCVNKKTDGNNSEDLIDAMKWAVTNYPANKYALILWDHGIGILDPEWKKNRNFNSQSFLIDYKSVSENERIQIEGLTLNGNTRGILFNDFSRTYMTNQLLSKALSSIKETVLKGKKIDLLGMDACLMAMTEVCYQAKNYAKFLVASQEVELAHGWHYSSFLPNLKKEKLTPMQLAKDIVRGYASYYQKRIQLFTQSAIRLDRIDELKSKIDQVVTAVKDCYLEAGEFTSYVIKSARLSCLQFSASGYIDLHSFMSEMKRHIGFAQQRPSKLIYDRLYQSIVACVQAIDRSVVESVSGRNLREAKGLSIYFPINYIDSSYENTDFAKDSLWITFLKSVLLWK